jgi:hypothetical protein
MNIANIIHNFTWRYLKTIHRHEIHSEQGKTTDDLLAELSQYGHPKLLQMDTGWWCFIEATDATAGAKLTIGSEIRHTHPARAISECLQRVEASGLPKHPTPDTTPPPRLRT